MKDERPARNLWIFTAGLLSGVTLGYGIATVTGSPKDTGADTEPPSDVQTDPVQTTEVTKPQLTGHPNVLVVMWDTVRADRMSLYGAERPTTPWLNQFSESSVVFEHAYASSYWTVPSHASIFTGLPVYAHDADASNTWLRNSFVTMPEHVLNSVFSDGECPF